MNIVENTWIRHDFWVRNSDVAIFADAYSYAESRFMMPTCETEEQHWQAVTNGMRAWSRCHSYEPSLVGAGGYLTGNRWGDRKRRLLEHGTPQTDFIPP